LQSCRAPDRHPVNLYPVYEKLEEQT